ncbi:MAG: DUF3429 domain-containing protein [Alphaproteobacteria bacterium]
MADKTWTQKRIPQSAAALGYAGAIPFIVASLLSWFPDPLVSEAAIVMLIGFSVVILSFMGGVRWGIATSLESGPTFPQLTIAIVPAAVSWIAMILGSDMVGLGENAAAVQLVLMIVAFILLLLSDLQITRAGEAPDWYPGLRIPLTLLVEASLIGALVKVIFYSPEIM